MSKQVLTNLANGKQVYFDDSDSHTATHFSDTPQLKELLVEYLATQNFTDTEVIHEHDVGRIIGNTDMVATDDNDEIVYAKRKNRETYVSFVKNKRPEPTSYFTFVCYLDNEGGYELASAWIGRNCPVNPGEAKESSESIPFWTSHALAWGTQEVQPETVTRICPWN